MDDRTAEIRRRDARDVHAGLAAAGLVDADAPMGESDAGFPDYDPNTDQHVDRAEREVRTGAWAYVPPRQ